jgi:hypothetical protein
MQFALNLPAFADFADPHALADLAFEAEQAGWDGFFIWDHMIFDPSFYPMIDPWVGLAAVAMRTTRMRIGTLLTPIPRRRPWKLARETVSLDRLSNGRLILGVGIGDPAQWEYGFFGEETDAKIRAQQLDEGLEILNGLWSGEPFGFKGTHYQLEDVRFLPRPIQQPRIPIWVGGWWPNKPPMRRAARWDGVCPGKAYGSLSVDEWRDILAYIHMHRTDDGPFDAVCSGTTRGLDRQADAQHVAAYAQVGCNWWVEDINPWRFGRSWEDPWTPEDSINMRERVRQGPPRL